MDKPVPTHLVLLDILLPNNVLNLLIEVLILNLSDYSFLSQSSLTLELVRLHLV